MINLLGFGLVPNNWLIVAAVVGGAIGYTMCVILAARGFGWGGSDFRANSVGFIGLVLGAVAGPLIWRVVSGGPIGPLSGPLIGFLVGVVGATCLGTAGVLAGFRIGRVVVPKVSNRSAEAGEGIGGTVGALAGIAMGVGLGVGAAMILG